MYGAGIGTGVSGGAMMVGLATGSTTLLIVAGIALGVMVWTLVRNARRRAAHQRP